MQVTAWTNGGGGYRIRIGRQDRESYFPQSWTTIIVEIDGDTLEFSLSSSFWRSCPEIRGKPIADWLRRNQLVPWPKGQPPIFDLVSLGGQTFRLVRR
jgi:hypothetical protein